MSCAENLRDLLTPLGVYRWGDGGFQWGELKAAGAALDGVAEELGLLHREADLTTAQDEGLQLYCGLMGRDYGPREPAELRKMLAAALRVQGGSFTRQAVEDALLGCGTQAELKEGENGLSLTVSFPQDTGPGEDWLCIVDFLENVLPCHVNLQYQFRTITWDVLEEMYPTWNALEAAVSRWSQIG